MKFRLRFDRPLKAAALADGSSPGAVIAGTTVGSEKNPNLTETRNGCDATTPALFSEELKQFCCSLEQQVHRLNSRYLETLSQFQELAVQLAMEVATAVVGYEVQHHENRIRQLLDRLVNRPESPIPMVIHVNKIDLERLRISLRDTTSLDSMLQLKNDDSLSPGDVRIESAEQRLIASCRQQLANIQKQLMEYLTNARPEPATS